MILNDSCSFLTDADCYIGVRKIAEKVKNDICMVTGSYPTEHKDGEVTDNIIIYGTCGRSALIEELADKSLIDISKVEGRRETYGLWIIEEHIKGAKGAVVIAGSDKRGTIYGLFHISKLMGVSPLVTWNHVYPKPHQVELTAADNYISKEPSVKYRGFFINDEWPAFGSWATMHFGGINAKCYERVFELLLRLKGNYLWPAMWNSNFNMDGPGLESAILADEYGIVMSTSHHEPCMRAGEEFGLLKGEQSIYGNDWNFITNREGITNFWRDGLIRNRAFENVITMGMRGERDSAILGKDAGLKANIDLLRDVLKTQNNLIKETINDNLDEVPRQIVLFTEVEEFFYGNSEVEGLMNDPELEGVTLMLSDNNFGYTRTLPSEQMRGHKGGYGMYYHLDMHGGAYSYQWIGSAYLPRVWEQMTQAYEFGVRDIWVVNIGDIGTQELGLSFFLDLAYDIEKWGGSDAAVTKEYVEQWVNGNFRYSFEEPARKLIENTVWDYTTLLAKRKHEIMNADVYHPVHYFEAQKILDASEKIIENVTKLKESCSARDMSAFVSLIYYPAYGTANLMKMWIIAGRNKLYAQQNKIEANSLAKSIDECLKVDEALVSEYEEIDNGYYRGFGTSPHIGFVNWNDEDCKYPIRHIIYPAKGPRMLLSRADDENYVTGQFWCDHPQTWEDFLRPDRNKISFEISNGGDAAFFYSIECDYDYLVFSEKRGVVKDKVTIELELRKEQLQSNEEAFFTVDAYDNGGAPIAHATVKVLATPASEFDASDGTFVESDNHVTFFAKNFVGKSDAQKAGFEVLEPYGREGSGIKVFPVTSDFLEDDNRPYTEYLFAVNSAGEYNIRFYLAPTTPTVFERKQYLGFNVNGDQIQIVNTVENEEIPFFLSEQWEREARDNVKLVNASCVCKAGENVLRFYGMSPGIVLEKVSIFRKGTELLPSYLGPNESYRVAK